MLINGFTEEEAEEIVRDMADDTRVQSDTEINWDDLNLWLDGLYEVGEG